MGLPVLIGLAVVAILALGLLLYVATIPLVWYLAAAVFYFGTGAIDDLIGPTARTVIRLVGLVALPAIIATHYRQQSFRVNLTKDRERQVGNPTIASRSAAFGLSAKCTAASGCSDTTIVEHPRLTTRAPGSYSARTRRMVGL